MSGTEHTKAVVECVQRIAFAGSDRPVPLDVPFDENGLGLDSLALVEVFTDLERQFGVEIFESPWFESGKLSVRSLGDYLAAATGSGPRGRASTG